MHDFNQHQAPAPQEHPQPKNIDDIGCFGDDDDGTNQEQVATLEQPYEDDDFADLLNFDGTSLALPREDDAPVAVAAQEVEDVVEVNSALTQESLSDTSEEQDLQPPKKKVRFDGQATDSSGVFKAVRPVLGAFYMEAVGEDAAQKQVSFFFLSSEAVAALRRGEEETILAAAEPDDEEAKVDLATSLSYYKHCFGLEDKDVEKTKLEQLDRFAALARRLGDDLVDPLCAHSYSYNFASR